jgi:hypothetical protein
LHDRADKNKLSNQPGLTIEFLFTLIHLKNLNHRLRLILPELFGNLLLEMMICTLGFKVRRLWLILRLFCRIAVNVPKIFLHRRISKLKKMPFLNDD